MSDKIKKLRTDMKRLPELCGFAENAKSPEARIIIKAKILEELDEIKKQVIRLYDA